MRHSNFSKMQKPAEYGSFCMQWCVEAESAEDARELLAAGEGYRCHLGDCVHVEVESVEE
jgi:hypothetical protein